MQPGLRRLPTGDLLPRITIQWFKGGNVLWARDLDKVSDDLESQYLAAQGDQLPFVLDVPGRGPVDGVLWCGQAQLLCHAIAIWVRAQAVDSSLRPCKTRTYR